MRARFSASGRGDAKREDRTLPRAEQHACRNDVKPRARCHLPGGASPSNVDRNPLGAVVSQADPPRAGRGDFQLRRRNRKGDPRTVGVRPLSGRGERQKKRSGDCEPDGSSHRASAVNVTVAE
jgi:hypothetical protein